MEALQIFNYNNSPISFNNENGIAFINATEMAKNFGKRVQHFLTTAQTKEYLEAISQSRNLGLDNLVQVVNG